MPADLALPADNRDRSVRTWVMARLMAANTPMLAEPRECEATCSRLMAGLDDRSRAVLEAFDRRYDEGELTRLQRQLARVEAGEPVQRVLGWTEFRGLRIGCSGAVLIPRPETEEVVGWFLEAMDALPEVGRRRRVLDVGTGSGCVALAIQSERPGWEVVAMDVSAAALEQARANAAELGLDRVRWVEGNALDVEAWPEGPWDGIVSNPPYIPQSEPLEPHVEEHEPELALRVPDGDPLMFYAALASGARKSLAPAGCMVAECHREFTRDVAECWQLEGVRLDVLSDLQGAERAVRLRRH